MAWPWNWSNKCLCQKNNEADLFPKICKRETWGHMLWSVSLTNRGVCGSLLVFCSLWRARVITEKSDRIPPTIWQDSYMSMTHGTSRATFKRNTFAIINASMYCCSFDKYSKVPVIGFDFVAKYSYVQTVIRTTVCELISCQ